MKNLIIVVLVLLLCGTQFVSAQDEYIPMQVTYERSNGTLEMWDCYPIYSGMLETQMAVYSFHAGDMVGYGCVLISAAQYTAPYWRNPFITVSY